MKSSDKKELLKYIRAVADDLELRDWTFILSDEPTENDSYGYVNPTYGRKVAIIKLCSDFRNLDKEKQRHTIVHELVHCHLESACNMVMSDLEQWLGKQTDQIFYDGFKRQMEYGVDGLAEALAKHQPFIAWPKKEKRSA